MKKRLFTLATTATILAGMTLSAYADGATVNETDNISGDLTVTSFFNEKTDAMKLQSGDQITFTFKNKSIKSQDKNWENFVLAIVGENNVGDLYGGVADEVLIIRADSWGWGGGLSDFLDPNTLGDGVNLNFKTDIADWDAWRAAAQKGIDCKVTIGRDGNTFHYEAKVGDGTVKMDATSGIDIPENCYVFLTGESCELTKIKSERSKLETASEKEDAKADEKEDAKEDTKAEGSEGSDSESTEIIRQSDPIRSTQLVVVDGDDGGNSSTVVVLAVVVVVVLVVVSGLVLATRKKK